MRIKKAHFNELQAEFEPAAISAVTTAVKAHGPALLAHMRSVMEKARKDEARTDLRQYMADFYEALLDTCPNRILSLFLRIAFFATRNLYVPPAISSRHRLGEYIKLHSQIVDAMEAGEEGLARRLMIELRREVMVDSPPGDKRADLIEGAIL
jgi:DNA-binding GntR family transcriptional regulator